MTLFLYGLFLDEVGSLIAKMSGSFFASGIFFLYIILGAFVFLNMMIGFQVDVASKIMIAQKEEADIMKLRKRMLPLLEAYDRHDTRHISKLDWDTLVMDPEFLDCLNQFGTDWESLIAVAELLYDQRLWANEAEVAHRKSAKPGDAKVNFAEILHVIQQL